MITYGRLSFELLFWVTALVLLASSDVPGAGSTAHLSICPLANLGFEWCPGCGLGRSLGYLLHGNLQESLKMHWFGVPALLILLSRIFILSKQELTKKNLKVKEKYHV